MIYEEGTSVRFELRISRKEEYMPCVEVLSASSELMAYVRETSHLDLGIRHPKLSMGSQQEFHRWSLLNNNSR